jgi:LCP family protein required for cell wall assembly
VSNVVVRWRRNDARDAPVSLDVRFRRTWPQRFLLLGGVSLAALSVFAASSLRATNETVANIQRISVPPGTLDDQPAKGEARNILIAGTTENDGIAGGDDLLAGRSDANLSDTIMLVRLDPVAAQATVLSVKFPTGSSGKINEAVSRGGMENLVRTVRENFDIPINDFVKVNFFGFRKLIDEIGGVPLYLPYPSRDLGSFFDGNAGCNMLNGEQALNYVRARHFQQLMDGRWKEDNKNDFGRTERQRDFMILAMDRAFAKGARNVSTIKHLIDVALEKDQASGLAPVQLDTELTPQILLDLGRAFSNFDPDALQRLSLNTVGAGIDGVSALKVLMYDPANQKSFDVFRGKLATLTPNNVAVRVLDARDSGKDTSKIDTLLTSRAFRMDGTVTKDPQADLRTAIEYGAADLDAARLLAKFIDPAPVLSPVLIPGVGLVVGDDFQGVRLVARTDAELDTALAAANAVTTTAKGTTTTRGPGTTTTTRPGASTTTGSTTTITPSTSTSTTTTTPGVFGRPPEGTTCA